VAWNCTYAIIHHIGLAIDLELGMAKYQPFVYLLLFTYAIGATARIFKTCKEQEIEEAIAEVLRNAPHRPGGLKFTVFCY
jgi:hypothetical protein